MDSNIIGWCDYCHSEVLVGEKRKFHKGVLYHEDCFIQKNTIYDPFEITEDE